MRPVNSKELSMPLAIYLRTVIPEAVDVYKNVKILHRQLRIAMAIKGSIPIRKDYVRS